MGSLKVCFSLQIRQTVKYNVWVFFSVSCCWLGEQTGLLTFRTAYLFRPLSFQVQFVIGYPQIKCILPQCKINQHKHLNLTIVTSSKGSINISHSNLLRKSRGWLNFTPDSFKDLVFFPVSKILNNYTCIFFYPTENSNF